MFVSCIQIFRPGGINGLSGTPNFLLTLDNVVRTATWNLQQIGGFQGMTLEMVQDYENVLDLQARNWVYFGCLGGLLALDTNAGATVITVFEADFDTGTQSIPEFNVGDYILVSDNLNTDLLKVASVTKTGNAYRLGLSAAPGQNSPGLLNSYSATDTRVVRLMYTGKMIRRPRFDDLSQRYTIEFLGFSDRYNNILCNVQIVKQDAAESIFGFATYFETQIPEIIVDAANFAPVNGIMCNSSSTNGQVLSAITDILRTENGQITNSLWTFDVDVVRQACHLQLSTDTPSVILDVSGPNPEGDICGTLNMVDQDITQLLNLALINGGMNAGTGQQIEIIVQDILSQRTWGFYEGSLNNPDLQDNTSAANWGAGQLNVLAYPRTTATLPLLQTSARISCRDLVSVEGWNDPASNFLANVNSIQYSADASKRLVTATLSLIQTRPDIKSIMGEISGEVSQRQRWSQPGTQLIDAYVVSGFDLTLGP